VREEIGKFSVRMVMGIGEAGMLVLPSLGITLYSWFNHS
jgi:hypothetical protein